MTTKNEKKKDKKKMLVLALFIFAVVGLAGYGVYSYYWTQGSFDSNSNTIKVTSFNPETYIDGNFDFLGNGGTVTLSCGNTSSYYYSNGHETVTCTGGVSVTNNGGTDITLEVEDTNASLNGGSEIASISSTSLKWDSSDSSVSNLISSSNSDYLNITVEVEVDNGAGVGESDDAVEVTSPVIGGEFYVDVSFRLKATQDHE